MLFTGPQQRTGTRNHRMDRGRFGREIARPAVRGRPARRHHFVPIDQQNRAGLGQQDSNERREFQTDGKHPKVRKQQLLILIIIIYYYDTRLKFFRDIISSSKCQHVIHPPTRRGWKKKSLFNAREREPQVITNCFRILSALG